YYAGGISYNGRPTELVEKDRAGLIEVEGVDGELMLSNDGHIRAKRQMESMIVHIPRQVEVINTTVGGAKIEGTRFMKLGEVIEQKLSGTIVEPDWHNNDGSFCYDIAHMKKQANQLKQEYEQFVE